MALPLQIFVGPSAYTGDGAQQQSYRADRTGALVTVQANGRYAEAAKRGQIYIASTPAAGVAVPIYSSTTQQCVLANPTTSTSAFWLRKIYFNYVSGTDVAGHFVLAAQTLLNNAITGTTSTSFITNTKLTGTVPGAGVPSGSAAQLYTAATVVAFTYVRGLGQNQTVQTAATANVPWQSVEDLDGSILMMPGSAIAVAANAAAFVTAAIAIEYLEAPVALAA